MNLCTLSGLLSFTCAIGLGAVEGWHHGFLSAVIGSVLGVAIGFGVVWGVFSIERALFAPGKFEGRSGSVWAIVCLSGLAVIAPVFAGGGSFYAARFVGSHLSVSR